jgi:competence ComEA-like helix-hairpin-helix protein
MQPQNLFQWLALFLGILIIGSAVACFRSNSQNPPQIPNDTATFTAPGKSDRTNFYHSPKTSKKTPKFKSKKSKIQNSSDPESDLAVEKISINTASVQDLALLPSISAKSAKKIVAWRNSHGNFFDFSEVTQIPGLSITTLKALRKYTDCRY